MHKKYVFFIDKKKFETDDDTLTVRQILVDYGGYDPQENILVLKSGGNLIELKDFEEVIEMKNGLHFTIFSNKPNPVS